MSSRFNSHHILGWDPAPTGGGEQQRPRPKHSGPKGSEGKAANHGEAETGEKEGRRPERREHKTGGSPVHTPRPHTPTRDSLVQVCSRPPPSRSRAAAFLGTPQGPAAGWGQGGHRPSTGPLPDHQHLMHPHAPRFLPSSLFLTFPPDLEEYSASQPQALGWDLSDQAGYQAHRSPGRNRPACPFQP